MIDSVTKPFPECIDYLVENIELDPYFNEYFQWALKNEIPTVIVSGGMEPIIRAILKNLVGPDSEKLGIVSNDVMARPGKTIDQVGGWSIKYHDERYSNTMRDSIKLQLIRYSGFGHDKSRTIRPYAQLPKDTRPTLFYAGDGVSDLSAARETDLLFAKQGHGRSPSSKSDLCSNGPPDLVRYCARESVPFTVFEDWSSILEQVRDIVDGKVTVDQAAREGYEQYKSGATSLNGHAK